MPSERGEIYRLAAGEAVRALRAALRRLVQPLRIGRPQRLLVAPQDLRTADATIATDIYGGRFVFAGRSLSLTGRSPFEVPVPSHAWAEAFYGFGWLRHLRAADTAITTANARVLVADFLARPPGRPSVAWRVPVVARRLLSFLVHSPFLIDPADTASYQRLLRGIQRCTAHLVPALAPETPPWPRLRAAIALTYAGLCCEGYDALLKRASRVLRSELDRQILPDGGHVGRNPEVTIDLILDLVPLLQAYTTRGVAPPQALVGAIDRMGSFLPLLRQGDGSLTHVNGTGVTAIDHLAAALAHAQSAGGVARRAPHAGYERIEAKGTLVVADLGAAPPRAASAEAHAGCLCFEMSVGAQRLVVNCGAPRGRAARLQLAARATAAHSTTGLAGLSSARFLRIEGAGPERQLRRWLTRRLGAVMLEGPRTVTIERGEEDDTRWVRASHDGFARRHDLRHERTWRLATDGSRLEGRDALIGAPREADSAVIRFHLHPAVAAQPSEAEAGGVLLVLPDGESWRFAAEGGPVTIEESVFFATSEGMKPSHQLVIRPPAPTDAVAWSFIRLPQGG